MSSTKRQWTEAQSRAISERAHTLLVSAAAGSGKTAVLTQRIIDRITASDPPGDINRMLVVTFTKAAANELKERVGKALSDVIAENPGNRYLRRQYEALPRASISTVHSFCANLIKRNYQILGLPPSLSVSDEGRSALLASKIMDNTLEEYYNASPNECDIGDFVTFIDNFVVLRDEKLPDILLNIYNKVSSLRGGLEFISESADKLEEAARTDFFDTVWGECVKAHYKKAFISYRHIFEEALNRLSVEKMYEPYRENFEYCADFNNVLLKNLEDGCTLGKFLTLAADFDIPRAKSVRGAEPSESMDYFKEMRDGYKKLIRDIPDKLMMSSLERQPELAVKTAKLTRSLYTLLRAFEKKYTAEKMRYGMLDFNDLERYASELLYPNGKVSDVALTMNERYDEIFIDEYQDTNSLQDMIFSAVGVNVSRFMVGDIKQSIYGFRGAEPSIFAGYRKNDGVKKIFLRHNFRCGKGIIDFINDVYSYIFAPPFSKLEYGEDDRLICGKEENTPPVLPELYIVEKNAPDDDTSDEVDSNEAVFVAKRIKELVCEGYEYSDITVLLRSSATSAQPFESAFKNAGIPFYNHTPHSLFENPEISIVMSLLNCIDNPNKDIYLAGVLKSPLYGFSLDDLIKIRRCSSGGSLYEALVKYSSDKPGTQITQDKTEGGKEASADGAVSCIAVKKGGNECREAGIDSETGKNDIANICEENAFDLIDDEKEDALKSKCHYFIRKLTEYRKKSEASPVDELIRYLYYDTSINVLVGGGDEYDKAEIRRRNLNSLYELARKYESGMFKGVYNFINYVNDLLERSASPANAASAPETGNTVKIMNIHRAKGLEFKVCFICDGLKKFNTTDTSERIIIDRRLGVTFKTSDSTGFARYDSLYRRASAYNLYDELLEEEARILYVALTRAKERLIVTASHKDPDEFLRKARLDAEYTVPGLSFTLSENASYMRWLAVSAFASGVKSCTVNAVSAGEKADTGSEIEITAPDKHDNSGGFQEEPEDYDRESSERLRAMFAERFAFEYPFAEMSEMPAKLSVSELYPELLDSNEDTVSLFEAKLSELKAPRFAGISDTTAGSAEAGTATHVFMQFCDFESVERNGVEAERERLTAKGFMRKNDADLINIPALEGFFGGEQYTELKKAKKLWRERRFNVRMPAVLFTSDEAYAAKLEKAGEEVLVQGVIDCFYISDNDELCLIDYKTDNVYGMNAKAAEKMLKERHRLQLGYYRIACEKMLCRKVDKCGIYSFGLGYTVWL